MMSMTFLIVVIAGIVLAVAVIVGLVLIAMAVNDRNKDR